MATTNVIEYVVRLRNEFSGQADKISTSIKGMQQQLSGKLSAAGFDDLGAAVGRIPLGLAAIGAGVGAVAAVGKAAFDAANDFTALALATDKFSQKTGASVEFLSTFTAAANDAEISTGTVNTALTKFADNLFTIKGAGANVEAELYALADLFARMPDGPEKTAIAINAFGKAGAEMIPILNQGSAALKGMQADMAEMGRIMTKEGVEAANAFDDAMDKLSGRLDGLKVRLGGAVVPALVQVADAVNSGVDRFNLLGRALDEVINKGGMTEATMNQIQAANAAAAAGMGDAQAKAFLLAHGLDESGNAANAAGVAFLNAGRSAVVAGNNAVSGASAFSRAAAIVIEGNRAMAQSMFIAGQADRAAQASKNSWAATSARYAGAAEKARLATLADTEALRANRIASIQTDASIDAMNASFEQTVVSGGGAARAVEEITSEQQSLIDKTNALKGALGQSTDEMDQGEQLQTAYALATGELSAQQFEQLQAVKGLLQAAKDQKISNEQALTTVLAMRAGLATNTDAFNVAGESGNKFKGEVDAVQAVVAGATTKVSDLSAKIKGVPKDTRIDIRAVVFGTQDVLTVKNAIEDLHDRHVTVTVEYKTVGSPAPGVGGGTVTSPTPGAGGVPPPGGIGPQRAVSSAGGTMLISTPINVNELNPRRAAMLIANAQQQAARAASLRARAGFG